MTPRHLLVVASLLLGGLLGAGCGESVPENPKPPAGTNAHVSGDPEGRIKNIEADPTLTAAEKTQRIAAIKERNHLP